MPGKSKWSVVAKKGKNFENFFISILAGQLAPKKRVKTKILPLLAAGYLQAGGHRYVTRADAERHSRQLQELLKARPAAISKSYRHYVAVLKLAEKFADSIPQNNFDRLDLISYFKEWSRYLGQSINFAYNYYFLDRQISQIILNALKRNQADQVFKEFEILSQSKELSVIQKEKRDLLTLVKKIAINHLSLTGPSVKALINQHLKKYAFMGMYYFRGRPWPAPNVLKRIRDWLKNNWPAELAKLNRISQAGRLNNSIMARHNFTGYEKQLVQLMKAMNFATNRFDEVHNYFAFKSQTLLQYLAKKIGVRYQQLIELNFPEVMELLYLNKKADRQLIQMAIAREKNSLLLGQSGQVKIYHGQKANQVFKREISAAKPVKTQVLRGQCACLGQAIGKAVLFRSIADLSKVKKGNIMVAVATVPSFVPAMEKAAAMVTEMGGLLSHAAIVSRELNIPCVVGVDGVIRALHDGDRIEVDATKGIVRKLK